MKAFQHLPLRLQHQTIEKIEEMQGGYLLRCGDSEGAFESFQRVAAIGYEVSGATFNHCVNLWRLVGTAMRCGLQVEAVQFLGKIRGTSSFCHMDRRIAKQAFIELTLHFSAPFWGSDDYVERDLNLMAARVWEGQKSP
jgi:hypothetical protein